MGGNEPRQDRFLTLSDTDLAGLGLTVSEIVDAIEAAVIAEANGAILTLPKSALLPGDGRYMMTTLASGDNPNLTVVKSVMVSPDNPGRGRPGIDGAILVQDSQTGQLLAVMQAGWITAMRTAGLSGVAARQLANPRSSHVAFIGTGVQARSHLQTFAELFPLKEISVFGRGQANIDGLCAMACTMGLKARACETPQDAVAGADLIVSSVTLSYDIDPFIDAHWLKPGAFAAISDLALPWVPDSMKAFDAIYVDDLEQERASPRKLVPAKQVAGDLKDLVRGPMPQQRSGTARQAFVFRGIAVGDFALVRLAWLRAAASHRAGITW